MPKVTIVVEVEAEGAEMSEQDIREAGFKVANAYREMVVADAQRANVEAQDAADAEPTDSVEGFDGNGSPVA